MQSTAHGALQTRAAKVDITHRELAGLGNLWEGPFEDVHSLTFLRAMLADDSIMPAAIEAADLAQFGDTQAVPERIEQ